MSESQTLDVMFSDIYGFSNANYTDEQWNQFQAQLSMITAGGALTLNAGGDIYGEALGLSSGGDMAITATGDVVFDALQNQMIYSAWRMGLSIDFWGKDLIDAAEAGEWDDLKTAALGKIPLFTNVMALKAAEDGWDLGAALTMAGIETYNLERV